MHGKMGGGGGGGGRGGEGRGGKERWHCGKKAKCELKANHKYY